MLINKSKIAIILLALCFILRAGAVSAYFDDIENSLGNDYNVGTLDFSLDSQQDFSPNITQDQSAVRNISVINNGSLNFQYSVSAIDLIGDLCSSVNLTADLNGQTVYDGPLANFSYSTADYSLGGNWIFTAESVSGNSLAGGENCSFKFVFNGWQTNLPDSSSGFFNSEEITNYLEYTYITPPPPPPPSSPFWQEDFESYAIGALNLNPKWGGGLGSSYEVINGKVAKTEVTTVTDGIYFDPGVIINTGKYTCSLSVRPYNWSGFYPGSSIKFSFRNSGDEVIGGVDIRRNDESNKFEIDNYNAGMPFDAVNKITLGNWILITLDFDFDNNFYVINASGVDGSWTASPQYPISNTPKEIAKLYIDNWFEMKANFDNISCIPQ